MGRRSRVVRVLGLLLVALGLGACSARRAYADWVEQDTRPAVFASARGVPDLGPKPGVFLGEVRGGTGLGTVAGDLSGMPNPIPVAFSEHTPPLEVLRADLERMLGSAAAGGLRLDVTLERAYVHRTYHVVKSSRMQGTVILDARLVDAASGEVVRSERVVGEHAERPAYITSEAVELALNAAYAAALERLADVLRGAVSPP